MVRNKYICKLPLILKRNITRGVPVLCFFPQMHCFSYEEGAIILISGLNQLLVTPHTVLD